MAKKTEKVKRKLRREQFVRVTSDLSLKELERFAAEGPPATERPQGLPLKDIHVAPRVFQWRRPSLLEDEQIMSELVQALNGAGETSSTLDPLVVTGIGKRFFVIDGHHRLDAYHTVKWKRLVPVRYHEGNIKQARTAALKLNVKNKLHMSQEEKSEAAWRMMLEGVCDPEHRWTWAQAVERVRMAVKETVPGKLPALEEVLEALENPYAAELGQTGLEEVDLPDTTNRLDFLSGL